MKPDSPFFNESLPLAGAWLTYFIQVLLAYLMTRAICALIPNPRARRAAWGCFLLLVAAGWLYVCFSALRGAPVPYGPRAAPLLGHYMRRSWPVDRFWAAQLSLGLWVWRVYLFAVALLLFDLLLKSERLARLLRTGNPASQELDLLFRGICCEMGLRRCALLIVPEIRSPATCGVWRPRVLFPEGLVPQVNGSQMVDVLRHELNHVKQRDYLWDRLAAVACTGVFFHPAVWLARGRFRWERELACDQAVLEAGGEPVDYAECLTKLARWSGLAGTIASNGIGFSSSSTKLATRVNTLLRGPRCDSPWRQAARIAVIILLATGGTYGLASLSLTFYWPGTSISAHVPSQVPHATLKQRLGSKPLPVALKQSLASEPPPPSALSNLYPGSLPLGSSSPPVPILKITPAGDEEEKAQDASNASTSLALHPVWNEYQLPGGPAPPSWQKVAVDAVAGAVGLATPDNDSDDNHSRPVHPR